MGLPKWIIKKYGITKKAWAVFRSGAKSTGGTKKSKKSGGHSGSTNKGGKMAKARKSAGKKLKAAMATRPGKVVMFAATAAAGGVGSALVVNKTPMLRDWPANGKAATQVGIGIGGIFLGRRKFRIMQPLGVGAVVFGIGALVKSLLKLDPMAGPSNNRPVLTREEMARLTGGNGRMGIPGNVRMGKPANVAMGGMGGGSGWNPSWG